MDIPRVKYCRCVPLITELDNYATLLFFFRTIYFFFGGRHAVLKWYECPSYSRYKLCCSVARNVICRTSEETVQARVSESSPGGRSGTTGV